MRKGSSDAGTAMNAMIEVEKYEDLPDNFSLYSPPFPGAKPTAYEIHVNFHGRQN